MSNGGDNTISDGTKFRPYYFRCVDGLGFGINLAALTNQLGDCRGKAREIFASDDRLTRNESRKGRKEMGFPQTMTSRCHQ